jgi:hypothetical protein
LSDDITIRDIRSGGQEEAPLSRCLYLISETPSSRNMNEIRPTAFDLKTKIFHPLNNVGLF